jgi:hypothetical protein
MVIRRYGPSSDGGETWTDLLNLFFGNVSPVWKFLHYLQRLEVTFNSSGRFSVTLFDQAIGKTDCCGNVERSFESSARIVVIRDRFDDRVRQSPKSEQIRTHFSMRDSQHLGFNFVLRPSGRFARLNDLLVFVVWQTAK